MKKGTYIYLFFAFVLGSCDIESPPERIEHHYDLAIPIFSHNFNMADYEGAINMLFPISGITEIPEGVELDGYRVRDFDMSYNFFIADLFEGENYIESLEPKYFVEHNLPDGIDMYVNAYVVVNGIINRFWFSQEWHKLGEPYVNKKGNKVIESEKVVINKEKIALFKDSEEINFKVKLVTTKDVKIKEIVKSEIKINVGMRASVYMAIDL